MSFVDFTKDFRAKVAEPDEISVEYLHPTRFEYFYLYILFRVKLTYGILAHSNIEPNN